MHDNRTQAPDRTEPYAWYLLSVLVVVYILNFIDRQLLTIFAPDLKRDLGISDGDFGFLYGTAFGVFYAVFGIPLGKLADRWSRVKLLSVGLALWSAMTALSGVSRNFGQVGLARIGVGIGEATAQPCAYSLISDYFPPNRRARALAIYSTGLYLGGGISLFIGSAIAAYWNTQFADGGAPFGLMGWQAAFLMVGIPGLLLALLVATLREPPRGRFDADHVEESTESGRSPFGEFVGELADVVPPFTLLGAAAAGAGALAANLAGAVACALVAAGMIALTGDAAQWIAVGIGFYAIFSWMAALRRRDPEAFRLLLASRTFAGVTIGYGLLTFIGYAATAFAPLYAIQELGADPARAGLILGSLGALGGAIGVNGAGMLTDRLARDGDHTGRVLVIALAGVAMLVCHVIMFTTRSQTVFYAINPLFWIFASATLGGAAGTVVNIVPARIRGVATAAFVLGSTLLGLSLGPYAGGKISTVTGDLTTGMLAILAVAPVAVGMLLMAWLELRRGRG